MITITLSDYAQGLLIRAIDAALEYYSVALTLEDRDALPALARRISRASNMTSDHRNSRIGANDEP